MSIDALSITGKQTNKQTENNPNVYPEDWMNRLRYVQLVEHFSAVKGRDVSETYNKLSESPRQPKQKNQTQRNTHWVIAFYIILEQKRN